MGTRTGAAADLRALVHASADGILILDRAGRVRFANPAAARLFGQAPADLAGADLGLPVLAGEAAEVDLVRRGGSPVAVEIRAAPLHWEGEEALVVTLRDVTERRRAEESARQLIAEAAGRREAEAAAARAEFLARAGAVLAGTLEVEGILASVAELGVPLLGDQAFVHRADEGGEPVLTAACPRDAARRRAPDAPVIGSDAAPADGALLALVGRVLGSGRAEWQAEPAEGPGAVVVVPLAVRGRVLAALSLVRPGPGRAHTETEVGLAEELARLAAMALDNARLFAEAQSANRAKSQFLATMSHEIRTPINAVMGYADLMDAGIAGALTPPQQEYLTRIRESSRHLLALVNDILDLSKIEAGEMQVRRERVILREVAEHSLDLIAPQAAAKGIELRREWECADGAAFWGDSDRVGQVAVNLLSNAVKFTDEGGQVTLRCRVVEGAPAAVAESGAGSWVVLEVEDTGIGVPPEQMDAIFDPFVQVDGGHTRQQGGTGLGLAISRRLARHMGGELLVESEPGQGSRFTLWLRADGDAAERPGRVASPEPAEPPGWTVVAGEVPGLGALGRRLADRAEAIAMRLAQRLRAEVDVPGLARLSRVELENHLATYLVDVGTTLVTLDEVGGGDPALLNDGHQIQRLLAVKHADQRIRLGWSADQLRREHALLREVVGEEVTPELGDDVGALEVLHRLLTQGEAVSLARFRRERR